MKRVFLFATLLLFAVGCTSKNHYTVTGNIAGVDDGKVYMFDSNYEAVDSTDVKNGAFRFDGEVDVPDFRFLATTDGTDDVFASFILEPGKLVITGPEKDEAGRFATGSPCNDAFVAMRKASKALVAKYHDSYGSHAEELSARQDSLIRSTYEANSGNYLGLFLLAAQLSYDMSGEDVLAELDKFSPELRQSNIAVMLREQAEKSIRTDIGKHYIDIEQPNADGKTISLKSVIENPANKYVLVDFWASWCGPCMGEVPGLVEAYKKYHSKGLEIYGVSFDKSADDWKAAIANNSMAWIQVSNLSSFNNEAAQDYSVQAIPSNFLIDCANGTIIAKNLRGEDVAKKFAELFE